jgi:hypothetical protein
MPMNIFKRRRRIKELEDRIDELSSKLRSLDYKIKILKYSESSIYNMSYGDKEEDWVYPSVAIRIILDHLGIAITRKPRPGFEIVELKNKPKEG